MCRRCGCSSTSSTRQPRWWDAAASIIYATHFILPFVVAGILYATNRKEWGWFASRFLVLCFLGCVTFALLPTAPPWYASQIGEIGHVVRSTGRGWQVVHVHAAATLIHKGQLVGNAYAAIPSLHAAWAALCATAVWRRIKNPVRWLVYVYPAAMALTLVYTGEHYLIDAIVGWIYLALICMGMPFVERAWTRWRHPEQGSRRLRVCHHRTMQSWPLRFGIFLPPMHLVGTNPTLNLQRDLELIEHLDRLGFDEAWIGEHHSAGAETIASPEVMIAAAAERTRHIKLGTGVSSLPYHHPLVLADRIVMLDHLTRGRMMFGVGPGQLTTDARMLGIDTNEQRRMMEESFDVMMALFKGETVTSHTDWFTCDGRPAADAALQRSALRRRRRRVDLAGRARRPQASTARGCSRSPRRTRSGFEMLAGPLEGHGGAGRRTTARRSTAASGG